MDTIHYFFPVINKQLTLIITEHSECSLTLVENLSVHENF